LVSSARRLLDRGTLEGKAAATENSSAVRLINLFIFWLSVMFVHSDCQHLRETTKKLLMMSATADV
jgi:hypothetical protein